MTLDTRSLTFIIEQQAEHIQRLERDVETLSERLKVLRAYIGHREWTNLIMQRNTRGWFDEHKNPIVPSRWREIQSETDAKS